MQITHKSGIRGVGMNAQIMLAALFLCFCHMLQIYDCKVFDVSKIIILLVKRDQNSNFLIKHYVKNIYLLNNFLTTFLFIISIFVF